MKKKKMMTSLLMEPIITNINEKENYTDFGPD